METEAVVTLQEPVPVALRAGGTAEARIGVVVAAGYHVQANPASAEFLIPLRLQLRGRGGVRPGQPVYPPGRPYRLPGADQEWLTYAGALEIRLSLAAPLSARPGAYVLPGTLRYQACDERSCLFPASLPLRLPVQVLSPARTPPPESDQ